MDIFEASSFINQDNPEVASTFRTAVEAGWRQIQQNPGIGRLRCFSIPGIRSWKVPGPFANWLMFYRESETAIEIFGIIHGARDLNQQLSQR
jgi:plasmid stabilization system protein ParE